MISTSLLLKTFLQTITAIYEWQSVINDALIDEWCKHIQACICAKGRYPNVCLRFAIRKKSSDFF